MQSDFMHYVIEGYIVFISSHVPVALLVGYLTIFVQEGRAQESSRLPQKEFTVNLRTIRIVSWIFSEVLADSKH
jgi:hypothetical protein